MSNVYHVLYEKPPLEAWDLTRGQEALALALVSSGLMRVDAGQAVNFVKFSYPAENIHTTFTALELFDETLLVRTHRTLCGIFGRKLRGHDLTQKVQSEIARMREEMEKALRVPAHHEMVLARLLVASAEPAVIQLMLLEAVKMFVVFSYSIGDVLDVVSWQESGDNSGMQSVYGQSAAVYVSCGGNPFMSPEVSDFKWDGYYAIARLMVIAGQEIGHFADVKRDTKGRKYSRHSSNFAATRAKEHVRIARVDDLHRVAEITAQLNRLGLAELAAAERHYRFYQKNKRRGQQWSSYRKINRLKRRFIRKASKQGFAFVKHLIHQSNMGRRLAISLRDTKFNLAPQADVYKREDPVAEEAVACVEALARVPQQVNKWGHSAVRVFMPNLYRIYYAEVIPECMKTVEQLTKQPFRYDDRRIRKPLWPWLKGAFRRQKHFMATPVRLD